MLLDVANGLAEGRIGLFQTHAVQYEAYGRHIKPLEISGHFAQLRASGHSRFDDDDGRIDKARQILRFRRDSQGSCISKYKTLFAGLGFLCQLLKQGSGAAAALGSELGGSIVEAKAT
jgi:hypothetical protein